MMQQQNEQQRIQRIYRTMIGDNERRIYSLIKDNDCTKKDLSRKTSLPSSMLQKILKQLSSYNLIKAIKKPQSKNLNVWVLYNTNKIEKQQQKHEDIQKIMQLISNRNESISIQGMKSEIIKKGYNLEYFNEILKVLQFKADIKIYENLIIPRKLIESNCPCIRCQLKNICTVDGIINPKQCIYLNNW